MNRKKALLLALVGACGLLLLCSRVWAWQTNINGNANGNDFALAVTVDGNGNVVAAGSTQNTGIDDFTVLKFGGASGEEIWRQVINGTALNSFDRALAVAVDPKGDVVAAGFTQNTGTFVDFTVVKFDGASGEEIWRQVINGTAIGGNVANAVTVDSVGNVVAAGSITNTLNSNDFTVIKFDGVTGTEIWRQVISSTAAFSFNRANAVTVDGADNVVAAGVTWSSGNRTDFTVVKYDGVSGEELWREVINGTANGNDQANAVTVDGEGNVVAVGATQNTGTFGDFTVVKFDGASGEEIWRQVINGTANGNDQANAVTVDGNGNVVAVGATQNTGTFDDFAVVKFDGASGEELWRRVINGTANLGDRALAVAVDAFGDVAAAGFTQNTGTGADFTVVKLKGEDGGDF